MPDFPFGRWMSGFEVVGRWVGVVTSGGWVGLVHWGVGWAVTGPEENGPQENALLGKK